MVISDLQMTKWREVYGLSITETMKLEFSDYMLMVDSLAEHTKRLAAQQDSTVNEMNKAME